MKRLNILQFGADGQVAREMLLAASRMEANIRAMTRDEVDFHNPANIARAVRDARADIVTNLVGYTAVDKAEGESNEAEIVNAEAVGVLADSCRKRDLPLIHVSTDYVFDGEKAEPYLETDIPNPINVYGRSKLSGEIAIAASAPLHTIVRTSWVYSAYRQNFVRTILRLAAERDQLSVVDDQIGSPTSARDIASTLLAMAQQIVTNPTKEQWGIFHYCGAGQTSWFEFAKEIVRAAAAGFPMKAKIVPIDSASYKSAARRPANSCLDCSKIDRVYGITPTPWRDALAVVIDELGGMHRE